MADKKLKVTLIKSTIGAVPKNKKTIEALGFVVVRVSNTDVYDNLDGVLEMIDATLRPL